MKIVNKSSELLISWHGIQPYIMERKIKGLEDHVKYLYDIIEEKETEIDNLKEAFNVVNDKCKRLSAAKSSDDEAIDNLEKENEEQRVKIKCLRKLLKKMRD